MQAGLPPDLEPFVEVRDTRKMDEPERRRIGVAAAHVEQREPD
jgi:hypothetical protein